MIEFLNVEKMFTSKKGIKNINLKLDNKVFGLIGANGVGKTTFLELMQGFILPDKGRIIINGIDTKDRHFSLANIAYVSSDLDLPANISVNGYFKMLGRLSNNENFAKRANKLSEMLFFNNEENEFISNLSTGMIQKIKIISCLSEEKEIYIFDEPTRGLDDSSKISFIKILKKLKSENKTIIYSTHFTNELTDFVDALIKIEDNEVFIVEKK